MSEERRSCEIIKNYGDNIKGHVVVIGNRVMTNESNDCFPVVTAYVEISDGQVIAVSPEQIRFTDSVQ